jgi:hypothetical protein
MARLFTFGCSFTQYMWPTWANIVAYDMNIEFYNFALAGLGNVGIQHRIVEADVKYNFQEDDIVLIMWTSWCREDRIKHGKWMPSGSVLYHQNDVYDQKFVKKYWDYGNDIVKNCTAIITANKLYKNNIKWQSSGFPFFFTELSRPAGTQHERVIYKMYKKNMPVLDHVDIIKKDYHSTAFNGNIKDMHPDVKEHLSIVENYVYEKLNLTLKQETKDEFFKIQTYIEKYFKNKKFNSTETYKHIDNILSSEFPSVYKMMNFKKLID